jgi:hypothetical protein
MVFQCMLTTASAMPRESKRVTGLAVSFLAWGVSRWG